MGLAEICASYTLEKLGKLTLIIGIATQVALPNMAFLSSIVKPEYAEKLYDYSTIPYTLIGGVVSGLLYYCSKKAKDN